MCRLKILFLAKKEKSERKRVYMTCALPVAPSWHHRYARYPVKVIDTLLKKVFIFKSQWSRNEYIRCCEIRATLVQTSRYLSTNSRVLLSCPRIGRSVVEEAEKGKKEGKADRTGATLSLTYRSNSLIKLPMNYSRVHAVWKKKEMTWRIFGKFVKVESTV